MQVLSLPRLISGEKKNKKDYENWLMSIKPLTRGLNCTACEGLNCSRLFSFQHLPGQHQKNPISPCQTQPGFPPKPFFPTRDSSTNSSIHGILEWFGLGRDLTAHLVIVHRQKKAVCPKELKIWIHLSWNCWNSWHLREENTEYITIYHNTLQTFLSAQRKEGLEQEDL